MPKGKLIGNPKKPYLAFVFVKRLLENSRRSMPSLSVALDRFISGFCLLTLEVAGNRL